MPIRDAVVPDDLTLVRALFAEYAASLEVDLGYQAFDEELAGLPGRYVAPAGGLWLAFEAGDGVGCVALRALDAGRCEIKRLYLKPVARGTGLGRRLALTAIERAAAAGHERVCLDTLPSMAGAIALYRSLQFEEVAPYYDGAVKGTLFFEHRLR